MEDERKRSKGSFFHFFDWNGKSRKKLFSSNSELAEGSKEGKENVESVAKTQLHAIEVDDTRANLSNKASGEFSCASSVTSDEGYGIKAPGVVARLMGLDSLPTSTVPEPSPFFNSSSLRASQYGRNTPNLWTEYDPMNCLNISSDQEERSWNCLESRSQKMQNRLIKRFQTEILPPKSAKSIPITRHKLLSPIKSHGFIPTENAAYIMEAAAKIIEASPKATMNSKVPSIGSSSVPLRIRDLTQKMGAADASRPQRSNELHAANNTKGQHIEKSQSGSECMSLSKASMFSEKGTLNGLRNKEKSVSLVIEAKSNGQRKKKATSSNNNIKKQKEITSNQSLKSLPSTQKTKRTSECSTSNVLRRNNQKQNCPSGKESLTSKKSVSNQPGEKAWSISGSVGQSRTVNKVVLKPRTMSGKMCLVVTDCEKNKPNNISQKKRSVDGDLQIGRRVSDYASFNRDDKSIKCNVAVDGNTNTVVDNRRNGMDVVSFTFTSPVKRTTPSPQPVTMGKNNSSAIDSFDTNDRPYLKNSSSGLNIIAGDALGVLLEQKLWELTNKVESSQCSMIRDENSASTESSLQNSISTFSVVSTIPTARDRKFQSVVEKDKSDHLDYFDCFSMEDSRITEEGSQEMEEHSSSSNFSEAEKDSQCRHPSPVSTLELCFETGGCSNTNVQSDGMLNGFFTNQSLEMEGETELSDSAFSISVVDEERKQIIRTFTATKINEASGWELDYIKDVLCNAELKLKGFALGQRPKVITPHLFHQLENHLNGTKRNEEGYTKIGRKVLFDCVSEWLEIMCSQTFVGSFKSWAKLWTLFQRKGWLAEELYKEISGWKNMGDLKVDELVDEDMGTQYGKWLDFNVEAYEEGIEIEKRILTSLVDELVSDLFTS